MHFLNKKSLIIGLCLLMQACTQVDDYLLGKDNTPVPKSLTEIKPTTHLAVKWSLPVGKSNKAGAYLKMKPAIRNNIVYIADTSGLVQAVDKHHGKVLWSTPVGHSIVSGPKVADGYIVVGTNAATLVVLKQSDGHQVWQAKLSEDSLSNALITNHKVIAKTIDGNLYAFDLTTGEKLWVADHGAPHLILKASSSPVVMDKLALVGFSDGKLDAVDINSGHVVWQRSIAFASGSSDVERLVDIDADPIIQGSVVYLASYQGYVGALSLTDGQFVWNKPASIYKNMAIDDKTLYITDSKDILWAIDKQNGQVKWKQTAFKARGLTEPVLMGNRLIVGDKLGYLHAVSAQQGEIIGRIQLSASIDFSPVVSGHDVYVMTTNGKLNCVAVS